MQVVSTFAFTEEINSLQNCSVNVSKKMRNPCQEQLEDVCTAIWCNLNVSDNVIGHNQNVIQTTLTGQRSSPHYTAVHCDTIILKEAYMPVYMKQFSYGKKQKKKT